MESVIKKIQESRSVLTIITKTKNEWFFIEKWINHHLAIIGDGKLIIFDNMSDNQHVLDVYEKYKEHIILIPFAFYYDYIHSYTLLKDFYDAVADSSDFFVILDSDEFLYLYDDSYARHDTSILDFLSNNKDCDFFAPCWLDNVEGKENLLNMNSEIHSIKEKADFTDLFDWGKPIVNSSILKNSEFKNSIVFFQHTLNLPALAYTKAKTHFFIAHLKNLNAQQRIITNMNKLVTHQLLSSSTDFVGLLKLKSGTFSFTLNSYIEQTQRLVKGLRANPNMPRTLAKDKIVEIGKDNKLHFGSSFAEKAFTSLLHCNYLDLINYDYSLVDKEKCPRLCHVIGKYKETKKA